MSESNSAEGKSEVPVSLPRALGRRMVASAWSSRKMPRTFDASRADAPDDANSRLGEGVPDGKIYLTEGGDLAGVLRGINGRVWHAHRVDCSLIHLGRRAPSRRRRGFQRSAYATPRSDHKSYSFLKTAQQQLPDRL